MSGIGIARVLRRVAIGTSALVAAAVLGGQVTAQHLMINRGNMAADALAFEHAVKKLASRDTRMQTLNSSLSELASRAEKFTWLAQRQGSYYALEREFANVTAQYTQVRNTIETAADWAQGHPRRQEWREVQLAFDRVYYNLYGYDLLDPYFGRHPDFAATPAPLRIESPLYLERRSSWRRWRYGGASVWEGGVQIIETPALPPTRGIPRQF